MRPVGISSIARWATALLLGSTGPGLAQTVDTTLWVPDGAVFTVVPDGGTIYIGGLFSYVGPATGAACAIDASTGAVQQPSSKVEGIVYAVAPDGSGGWYLGGNFAAIRGQARNHLAHLDAGGNLTGWNPSADNEVRALAVSGSTVYAGGSFSNVGGQARLNIAALDATSGAATAWNPNAGISAVWALAVSWGTVYAGGEFTRIGGQPRAHIAALDAATGAASTWNPNANLVVQALAVGEGTVYAGGLFTTIGGQPRAAIAALDAASGAATAWNPSPSGGGVFALALSGGTLYAGGQFTSIGGQPRARIAALDTASGAATAWSPNAAGAFINVCSVRALSVNGGTIYAGGDFISMGARRRNRIAALDAASGMVTDWDPNANSTVRRVAVSGGTVYAVGDFTSIGGQPRNRIAALDAASGTATAWNPNANGIASCLAVSGGTVYAGGRFTSIGGQPRGYIAALDAATGAATAWSPNADSFVFALAANENTVYAGGAFAHIGGQPRGHIAALDTATGAAAAWSPEASGTVSTLAVGGGTVYASGSFTAIGGQPRNRIAAVDAITGAATPWNPNPSLSGSPAALVQTLASSGTVYAGGVFDIIGGQARNNIAALDPTNGNATPWDAGTDGGPVINPNAVNTLAVSGGTVYVGGAFINVGGLLRPNLAALSADATVSVGGDGISSEGALTLAPNPTRSGMQIRYTVARAGRVRLELIDVSGRAVATLVDRSRAPGRYVFDWDVVGRSGRPAPGLYFVRLTAPRQVMLRKAAILR